MLNRAVNHSAQMNMNAVNMCRTNIVTVTVNTDIGMAMVSMVIVITVSRHRFLQKLLTIACVLYIIRLIVRQTQ